MSRIVGTKPFFGSIHVKQEAFDALTKFVNLECKTETNFSLFYCQLQEVKPLEYPKGDIFHIKYRYAERNNNV